MSKQTDSMTENPSNAGKFTPGPWNVMPSKRSALIHVETDANCVVGAGIPICSIPGNALGNAMLIAAAPELLAASEQFLKAVDAYYRASEIPQDKVADLCVDVVLADEKLRAVISKAKGTP